MYVQSVRRVQQTSLFHENESAVEPTKQIEGVNRGNGSLWRKKEVRRVLFLSLWESFLSHERV